MCPHVNQPQHHDSKFVSIETGQFCVRKMHCEWRSENKQHYTRDVTRGEDVPRIRRNPGVFARLLTMTVNGNAQTIAVDDPDMPPLYALRPGAGRHRQRGVRRHRRKAAPGAVHARAGGRGAEGVVRHGFPTRHAGACCGHSCPNRRFATMKPIRYRLLPTIMAANALSLRLGQVPAIRNVHLRVSVALSTRVGIVSRETMRQ